LGTEAGRIQSVCDESTGWRNQQTRMPRDLGKALTPGMAKADGCAPWDHGVDHQLQRVANKKPSFGWVSCF
jgi:hypothetical protein